MSDLSHEISTLILSAHELGVKQHETRRVQEKGRDALLQLVRYACRNETVSRRIADAERALPGLYAAEYVAREADAREHEDEEDFEYSDPTLAVIFKRKEAERLVRAAEFLAKYTEEVAA